jgi:hypothetical protein
LRVRDVCNGDRVFQAECRHRLIYRLDNTHGWFAAGFGKSDWMLLPTALTRCGEPKLR